MSSMVRKLQAENEYLNEENEKLRKELETVEALFHKLILKPLGPIPTFEEEKR